MWFDRVLIAVPDLACAVEDYRRLLGVDFPALAGDEQQAWLGLPNTVLELVKRDVTRARIVGIVFGQSGNTPAETPVANNMGLELITGNGSETAVFRATMPEFQCVSLAVDHLVLRTTDAEACIALFRDELGLRLALDQAVPEWGGRMLFFRAGKLTLEVIAGSDEAEGDRFWGIAFQCQDIELERRRLYAGGVAVSEIRDGRKPGTRVATVSSHSLGLPTLLIQPVV